MSGLWVWAQGAYARPGVSEHCLRLQDSHGQNVSLLLWAAWAGPVDAPVLTHAAEAVRAWEHTVVAPLRMARRAAKDPSPGIDAGAQLAAREAIAAAELRAERALLESLELLTEAAGAEGHTLTALRAAALAWGAVPPEPELARLAAALDGALLSIESSRAPVERAHRRPELVEDEAELDEAERAARARLVLLMQEHADLDAAAQSLSAIPLPDLLVIGRLKRKKLALKDEIARIQDQLTPDIIA
ncbi:TIGR02444 family protein [Phenylobacterium sp.]|uniref:TIGR02444 family protein n=1 Tax=Phenylobacterium sp. TaxID=1871053 RepID=UPI003523DC64